MCIEGAEGAGVFVYCVEICVVLFCYDCSKGLLLGSTTGQAS